MDRMYVGVRRASSWQILRIAQGPLDAMLLFPARLLLVTSHTLPQQAREGCNHLPHSGLGQCIASVASLLPR